MELLKKLKINTDQPLWLINVPEDCAAFFDGVSLASKPSKKNPATQAVLFAADSKTLNHYFPVVTAAVSDDTLLWLCYPKKSGAIKSDLVQPETWGEVFKAGYHGVTEVAINKDWTGFRIKKQHKIESFIRATPIEERKVEGIDFVNRTVALPADALAALNEHDGMTDFFSAMAFTHKKEYVMAIVEAKKAETRMSRIQKTVTMLQQKMEERAARKK